MLKIFKYPIATEDAQTIQLPEDAKILTVKTQHGKPCVWVLLDPDAQKILRHFTLYTTGGVIPERIGKYIGTFQMHNDSLVLHMFEDA